MPKRRGRTSRRRRQVRNYASRSVVPSIPRLNSFPLSIARSAVHECQWRIHNGPDASGAQFNQFLRVSLNSLFHYPTGYLQNLDNGSGASGTGINMYAQHAPLDQPYPTAIPNAYQWTTPTTVSAMPAHMPGLFDNPTSPGKLYQKYCVIGCKITVVFLPQRPDKQGELNPDSATPPVTHTAAMEVGADTTTPSMFYVNYQNTPQGGQMDKHNKWDEIKDRPRMKAVRVEGNYAGPSGGGDQIIVNKKGKQARLECTYSPRTAFTYDTILDAERLWGNTGTGVEPGTSDSSLIIQAKQSQPIDHSIAAIGIVPLFPAPGTAAVSGILQMRIEKTILFKDPFVTTASAQDAQANAPGMETGGDAGGPAGGNYIPQSALYRAGSTLGAAFGMAASLY